MATLDELQVQLASLTKRVDEITTPPDDYYTHRFSGEEIDNAVDRVKATPGSGAITYGDVGAAPSGYGLGNRNPSDIPKNELGKKDLNLAENTGWYYILGLNYNNFPDTSVGGPTLGSGRHLMRVESYSSITQTIYFSFQIWNNCIITRHKYYGDGQWSQWEWVNPPMRLGVEYRTIKRVNGVPVYKQLVNWGNLPNNTRKDGSLGITGLNGLVSCQLQFSNLSDLIPWDNPNSNRSVKVHYISPYNLGAISVTTNYDASGSQMWANIEYTKSS